MYRIEIAPTAMAELRRIVTHISKELYNPAAAAALLERVEACYERLEENPLVYEVCHDPQLKLRGYRRAVIKNYIMIYRVDEENGVVHILHFVYGPRDYAKLV